MVRNLFPMLSGIRSTGYMHLYRGRGIGGCRASARDGLGLQDVTRYHFIERRSLAAPHRVPMH